MAVEHLRSHGYKLIVCVTTDFHLRPVRQRVVGYEDQLKRAKLPAKKIILKDASAALPVLKKLFAAKNRPQALFTTNNVCTIAVIQALQRLGIKIGRDVAIVGFDDVDFYTLLRPPMTTVGQPVAEVGRTVTRLLLSRIRGTAPSSSARITLPVSLVIRESCGCKPAALSKR
jgi:LacI family transcriptional regulator